jgi:hypothetical protein
LGTLPGCDAWCRRYDSAILEWTKDISEDRFNGALRDLARVKYHPSRERLHTDIAEFKGEAIDMSLDRLMQQAEELAQEQQHVLDHSLARDYLRWQEEYVVCTRACAFALTAEPPTACGWGRRRIIRGLRKRSRCGTSESVKPQRGITDLHL